MPSSVTIFGVTFYIYGLIIGVAVVITLKIAEYFFSTSQEKNTLFWRAMIWGLVGALVGARIWHIVTDWQLYSDHWYAVLFLWNGGLSIIGALMGIFVGLWIVVSRSKGAVSFWEISDALVLGLPFGQAVGRLGNWVNQELYGQPTQLPWKLYIDPIHRVVGYQQFEYFHPLFAYEAIALFVLGGILVSCVKKKKLLLGSGILTLIYIAAYSWIRFGLEFLRIDKAELTFLPLGVNQAVVLVVAIVSSVYILKKVKFV